LGRIYCGTAIGRPYPITRENLALVAAARIERVEIAFYGDAFAYRDESAVREAERALAATGVASKSVHLDFGDHYDFSSLDEGLRRRAVEDAKTALRACRALGAAIAVVHGSDEPVADGDRAGRLGILNASLAELCQAARDNGVRLALELLPRTCLGHTSAEALAAVKGLAAETIGFCVDTNHVNIREDPAAVVWSLGRRILTFHISDNDGVDERHWFPFEGVIDWKSFMAAVKGIGYEGQFIFETSGSLGGDVAGYLEELRGRFDRLMAL